MTRIAFLFNHYFTHQVPHAAPYAFELSRENPDMEVVLACSSTQEMEFARKIGTLYPGHRCRFLKLRVPWFYRMIDPFVSNFSLKRKTVVLRYNLDFFRSVDVLVAPERHCMKLRTHFGLERLVMIHTRHGAGDRKGGFDDRSGAFDLTLLPGQKYVDRLTELGILASESRYAVTGWPKFEVVQGLKPERPRLFENDNPVVVYNPHFDQSVSSWCRAGLDVLEFFAAHPEWNLVFAPHVVLFKRRRRHNAHMPRRFYRYPNILVDLGSVASTDMTYMLGADIYLGDVSSQVYEFLLRPRPCIFLNAHELDWEGDPFYFHWTLGQVVDRVDTGLEKALECAFDTHGEFLQAQKKAFSYTFYSEPGSSAAQRGARAIARFTG
jgi:CDP-glycerol glycerophosphotransferase (TagB/SpsB family)